MAMSSGGKDDLNAEINVTPLVDVMLVLLIIFMITAPMMNTGVDIDLPQVTAKEVKDPEGKLILSIGLDKRLHISNTIIPWSELTDKLKALIQNRVAARQDSELYIEADTNLPYGVVVTAMAIAKNAGVTKVMMLTDPAENLDLKALDQTAGR
ncbi:MAG TPA: ExbD/TolR family protein [Kofleriaceae bacterium]|nr:ExbD/TolR family protein [Kofleriaceae bacterium]